MSRTFIKSILIAAVTVTGVSLATASPAKAGSEDIAKILVGATALFIIGKAITDSDAKAAPVTQPKRHKPTTRLRYSKALPAHCLRRYNTWEGRVRMMSRHCLQDNYRFSQRLPDNCRARVRTQDGPRRGYSMRCLRNQGYYLASR